MIRTSAFHYFRLVKVGGRTLDPQFEYECRFCGQRFPGEDRTGRDNGIGRRAHISKHLKQKMEGKALSR